MQHLYSLPLFFSLQPLNLVEVIMMVLHFTLICEASESERMFGPSRCLDIIMSLFLSAVISTQAVLVIHTFYGMKQNAHFWEFLQQNAFPLSSFIFLYVP